MIIPLGLKSKLTFTPWVTLLLGITLIVCHFISKDRALAIPKIRSQVLKKYGLLEYSLANNHLGCVNEVRAKLINKAASSGFKRTIIKLTSEDYINESRATYQALKIDNHNPMSAQNISITCSILVNYMLNQSSDNETEDDQVDDSGLDPTIRQSALQYLQTEGRAFIDHEYLFLSSLAEAKAPVIQEKIIQARAEITKEIEQLNMPIIQPFDFNSGFKSSFMHNNLGHLFGNLVFFIPHAICIEAVLGPISFLFLVLASASVIPVLATLAGGENLSMIPPVLLGFSGTVSFIMGMFLSLFNNRKYNALYILAVIPIFITVPTVVGIISFIASNDFLKALSDRLGIVSSDVSFESHLIGLALGIVVATLYKRLRTNYGNSQFKSEIKIFLTLSPSLSHEMYAKKVLKILDINPENYTVLDLFFSKIANSSPSSQNFDEPHEDVKTLLSGRLASWLNSSTTPKILSMRLQIINSFPKNWPLFNFLSQCTQHTLQSCLLENERLGCWFSNFHFLEYLLNSFTRDQLDQDIIRGRLAELLGFRAPLDDFYCFIESFPNSSLAQLSPANIRDRYSRSFDKTTSKENGYGLNEVSGESTQVKDTKPPPIVNALLSALNYSECKGPTVFQHLFAITTDLVVLAPLLKLVPILEMFISKYYYLYSNQLDIITSMLLGILGFSYFAYRSSRRLLTIGELASGFQFVSTNKNGVLASPAQLITRECCRILILAVIFMLPILYSANFNQFIISGATCAMFLLFLNAINFYPWDYFSKVKPICTSAFEPFRLKMQ